MRQNISTAIRCLLLSLLLAPIVLSAADEGTVVRFETSLGNIDVELFDNVTPQTVDNFLNYVNGGDFTNSFFHRSVPGFIIQGGGYTFRNNEVAPVPADPPIINEFNRSSVRGTIAMAKLSGQPNSATSEWFFNLTNNSEILDQQNGGFTVFGRVIGNGMQVVDAIAALTVWDAGGAFTELPLIDYSGTGAIVQDNLALINRIVIVPGSTAPTDSDNDGVPDNEDNCPGKVNVGQADVDSDGVGDVCDVCPGAANPGQADTDSDGIGNVCDVCPDDANVAQKDVDDDGVGDVCDVCPDDANATQEDADTDGIGDVCDICPRDAINKCNELCFPIKTPNEKVTMICL